MTDPSLPLCFVLMPFGKKQDGKGRDIDFDDLYDRVYRPAIQRAEMDPLRADEERDGGVIHKPMFERLVLCPYAIADLTLANANVFYELGVRHATRPYSTLLVYDKGGQRLPFDVAPLRAVPYEVDAAGLVVNSSALQNLIVARLEDARSSRPDSPLYQLLDGFTPPDIARLKTDVFRDQVKYSEEIKAQLRVARQQGLDAVKRIHATLTPIRDREAGVSIDLFLSYRDVNGHQEMIDLVDEMPEPIARSALVQEQLAFALNRVRRSEDAESVLRSVLDSHGPSSETYGLLGRVHKDRWLRAVDAGNQVMAAAHLRHAVDAYKAGFEADWRDAYPGVNTVTMLDVQGTHASELLSLLPVVRYAVRRRLDGGSPDYWDHASMLEVSVLMNDEAAIEAEAGECLASNPPRWFVETTLNNLSIIRSARFARGDSVAAADLAVSLLSPAGT